MTKLAIVGSSHLSKVQEKRAKDLIYDIFSTFKLDTEVISGGARGIDSLVRYAANKNNFKFTEYKPKRAMWSEFKERNLKIAEECDQLICIAVDLKDVRCYHHNPPADHQKTAGCWTMNKAVEMGKKCKLLVIRNL